MKQHQMRRGVLAIAVAFLAIISTSVVSAQSLEEVLGVRANTTQDGRKSQIKIDELTDQTRDLLSQFK